MSKAILAQLAACGVQQAQTLAAIQQDPARERPVTRRATPSVNSLIPQMSMEGDIEAYFMAFERMARREEKVGPCYQGLHRQRITTS
jgi:hypothetical protein